jgi:hypothetical protein
MKVYEPVNRPTDIQQIIKIGFARLNVRPLRSDSTSRKFNFFRSLLFILPRI